MKLSCRLNTSLFCTYCSLGLTTYLWLFAVSQTWATEPQPAFAVANFPAPIAHWKLDDVGREAQDSVGENHGTINGAISREGKFGKALLFDRSKEITSAFRIHPISRSEHSLFRPGFG